MVTKESFSKEEVGIIFEQLEWLRMRVGLILSEYHVWEKVRDWYIQLGGEV